MQENKFMVEVSYRDIMRPMLIIAVTYAVLMPLLFIFVPMPYGSYILVAGMVGSSLYMVFKMMRPDEYVLKVDSGFASLFKNTKLQAESDAASLRIKLFKVGNYGNSGLGVRIGFPNGKKLGFHVLDKRAVFSNEFSSEGFVRKPGASLASSMQVQRLLNYYRLNHLVTFENIY